jgi:phage portal protein BeeE
MLKAHYEASSDIDGPQMIGSDDEANGEIFYQLRGNDVIEQRLARNENWMCEPLMVPARDVLHIRLHSNRSHPRPLIGETPLTAAFGDMAMYERMKDQQTQFLENRAAPRAVLSTDLNLDGTQVQALRDRWNEQAKGLHAGGVPILTHGLATARCRIVFFPFPKYRE